MKTCKLTNCDEKHWAKGYCRKHYRKFSGEYKKRWEKVKNDDELYEKMKIAKKRYSKTERGKKKKAIADSKYYQENKARIREYRKEWFDETRFGKNRKKALKRAGYKCEECGLTREQHYSLWDCDLHVDHIDGKGRSVPKEERNNSLDNLKVLCRPCHMRKGVLNGEI